MIYFFPAIVLLVHQQPEKTGRVDGVSAAEPKQLTPAQAKTMEAIRPGEKDDENTKGDRGIFVSTESHNQDGPGQEKQMRDDPTACPR